MTDEEFEEFKALRQAIASDDVTDTMSVTTMRPALEALWERLGGPPPKALTPSPEGPADEAFWEQTHKALFKVDPKVVPSVEGGAE